MVTGVETAVERGPLLVNTLSGWGIGIELHVISSGLWLMTSVNPHGSGWAASDLGGQGVQKDFQ